MSVPSVRYHPELEVWSVDNPATAARCLTDRRLSSRWPAQGLAGLHGNGRQRLDEIIRSWFMFLDPPEHTRLRHITAQAIRLHARTEQREMVTDVVRSTMPLAPGRVDLVRDLSYPVAGRVTCRLLGLAEDLLPFLGPWSHALAELLVADYRSQVAREAARVMADLSQTLAAALADPRPGTALWRLRSAREDGRISPAEALAVSSLLLYAGFETSNIFLAAAVSDCVASGRLAEAVPDPTGLVEEMLRRHSSVPRVARRTLEEITVDGVWIPPAALVLLTLRDTAGGGVTDPDGPDAVPFGRGVHYCLGASLARTQAAVLLSELAARWPAATIAGPASHRFAQGMRVIQAQPLVLAADHPGPDATANLAPVGGARRIEDGSAHG